jgi:hypothetical protein
MASSFCARCVQLKALSADFSVRNLCLIPLHCSSLLILPVFSGSNDSCAKLNKKVTEKARTRLTYIRDNLGGRHQKEKIYWLGRDSIGLRSWRGHSVQTRQSHGPRSKRFIILYVVSRQDMESVVLFNYVEDNDFFFWSTRVGNASETVEHGEEQRVGSDYGDDMWARKGLFSSMSSTKSFNVKPRPFSHLKAFQEPSGRTLRGMIIPWSHRANETICVICCGGELFVVVHFMGSEVQTQSTRFLIPTTLVYLDSARSNYSIYWKNTSKTIKARNTIHFFESRPHNTQWTYTP